MCTLYERITALCKEKGVTGSRMCLDLGLSKSTMSDMKSGRKKGLSTSNAQKIANYLGVSVDYLLGVESNEWCSRFRSQLSTILTESNRDDMIAADVDIEDLLRIAEGETNLTFDRACDIADALGVSIDFMLGKEKAPTEAGERIDMSEVDIAFYGDYKELSDDDQKTIRDMVRVMRERRAIRDK